MNPFLRLAIPLVLIGAGLGALFTFTRKESKENPSASLPAPKAPPVAAPPVVPEPVADQPTQ